MFSKYDRNFNKKINKYNKQNALYFTSGQSLYAEKIKMPKCGMNPDAVFVPPSISDEKKLYVTKENGTYKCYYEGETEKYTVVNGELILESEIGEMEHLPGEMEHLPGEMTHLPGEIEPGQISNDYWAKLLNDL
jgi:hypothetical protein